MCGRVAAQMLTYPFHGDKRYATSPLAKVSTWLGQRYGAFDGDGYHSYCHSPGTAYCWSYTYCLEEMMKWLCSQNETAGACCPSDPVATACSEDVNSPGCQICVPTDSPPLKAEDAGSTKEIDPVVVRTKLVPEETLAWLTGGTTGPAVADTEPTSAACPICEELRAQRAGSGPIWAAVETMASCRASPELCTELCFGTGSTSHDEFSTCEAWSERCDKECSSS